MYLLDYYTCGGIEGLSFDGSIPTLVSTVVTAIQIVIPILLIIFGMLDLGKAVMAQKEDEIKKGQQTFIKRIIAAVILFMVIFIVRMIIGLVAGDENESITECIDCFINGVEYCN